ncbi:MAG: AAA family ATPase [Lachnospiraceae bacterium]|nr:AAA family ATPase [Lachnospiraceae bacterium]MEE3461799.1 AAA family ATPase [Lachnospiraceae bacterium]
MDKYIGTTETAGLLNVTTRRIVGMCRTGELPGAVQKGRRWQIPMESVQKLASERHIALKARKDPEELKPCAVGNTSYVDVSKDCYYVDKTLLVKELIDDRSMVTLFTRPRRFGKTLALSMLKTFFEISESDTSVYFQDKAIWRCKAKYREQQGKYPVIFLTFKDVKYDNWAACREAIRIILRDEYRRHEELSDSPSMDPVDRDYYLRMIKGTLSQVEYSRALLNLTHMLSRHYQKQTVILIDEYDTPIQQGFMEGFYGDVISFMRNLLSGGLKDNENLAFGVLTGILRVSKENLFSGLNNLAVNTVLDEKYSKYFGFTKEEVLAMAKYYGREDRIDEIREWYDGYRFGETEIFNPWSVSSYFYNDCVPKNFWINTSDNEILQEVMRKLTPEVAGELLGLMQGKRIFTQINTEVFYPRISDGPDAIFSFLLLAGYLTPEGQLQETEVGTYADLRLPNREIQRVYNKEILSWVKGTAGVNAVTQIEKAIYLNDPERLQAALRAYMMSCISSFDGAAEGFYHGMVLGLVASLSSRYYIRSNRESGEGRFDVQLEPKAKTFPGILMEFKAAAASDKEKLPDLAKEALRQIDDRSYKTEMQERGIRNIVYYGISFAGKDTCVKIRKVVLAGTVNKL